MSSNNGWRYALPNHQLSSGGLKSSFMIVIVDVGNDTVPDTWLHSKMSEDRCKEHGYWGPSSAGKMVVS